MLYNICDDGVEAMNDKYFRFVARIKNWDTKWNRVMFSHETRFCLWVHYGRRRVRRLRGEHSISELDVERGVMVWGAITYHL